AFVEIRLARRKTKTAVAQHQRRHPVPSRYRAVGIPAYLRIVVRMQIDESRRHDQPVRIDYLLGEARRTPAYLRHLPILDPDVATKTRYPRPIDDRPAFDLNVVLSHPGSLLIGKDCSRSTPRSVSVA